MARNSKDFKDLMRQKQSSRGKQKNMEALIEKMQRGGFGESSANMLREPKGHPKMAKILQELVSPYLDSIHTLKQHESLFTLGAIAWNIAVMHEFQQEIRINDLLEEFLSEDDAETQEVGKQIVAELIARKHQYFSDIRYFILNFEVTETREKYDIFVFSALLEDLE